MVIKFDKITMVTDANYGNSKLFYEEGIQMYSYKDAVRNAVKEWMEDNDNYADLDRDEREDTLLDYMMLSDSVTGNASGSYTLADT